MTGVCGGVRVASLQSIAIRRGRMRSCCVRLPLLLGHCFPTPLFPLPPITPRVCFLFLGCAISACVARLCFESADAFPVALASSAINMSGSRRVVARGGILQTRWMQTRTCRGVDQPAALHPRWTVAKQTILAGLRKANSDSQCR